MDLRVEYFSICIRHLSCVNVKAIQKTNSIFKFTDIDRNVVHFVFCDPTVDIQG